MHGSGCDTPDPHRVSRRSATGRVDREVLHRRGRRRAPAASRGHARRRAGRLRSDARAAPSHHRGTSHRGPVLASLGDDPASHPRTPSRGSQGGSGAGLRRRAHDSRVRREGGELERSGAPARPIPRPSPFAPRARGSGSVHSVGAGAGSGPQGHRAVAEPRSGPGVRARGEARGPRVRAAVSRLSPLLAGPGPERSGAGMGPGRRRVRDDRRLSRGDRGPCAPRPGGCRSRGRRVAGDESRRPAVPMPRLRLRRDVRGAQRRDLLSQLPTGPRGHRRRRPGHSVRPRRRPLRMALSRGASLLDLPGARDGARLVHIGGSRGLRAGAVPARTSLPALLRAAAVSSCRPSVCSAPRPETNASNGWWNGSTTTRPESSAGSSPWAGIPRFAASPSRRARRARRFPRSSTRSTTRRRRRASTRSSCGRSSTPRRVAPAPGRLVLVPFAKGTDGAEMPSANVRVARLLLDGGPELEAQRATVQASAPLEP